ncbi:MAG: phosphohydrolase [Bacteroidota bacterium]|nr:phosphohydrolase [Bacteroidota bacterium]
MATLQRAVEIATEAHKNQVDKNKDPYILHILRVMNAGRTINEKIVGILHDLIEDTSWTFGDLEREGFSEEVVDAIKCLTKKEDEDYNQFVERVKTNSLAIKIKINDLLDNLDIKRLNEVTDKDIPRLNKYLTAYGKLINL